MGEVPLQPTCRMSSQMAFSPLEAGPCADRAVRILYEKRIKLETFLVIKFTTQHALC